MRLERGEQVGVMRALGRMTRGERGGNAGGVVRAQGPGANEGCIQVGW